MPGRRILITGIASYLGTELARRLEADPEVEYVAGLDTRRPRAQLEKTDFIEADIRNPVIAKLIAPTGVDTIVHNQIVRRPTSEGYSPRKAHDVNVIGSLQLLAACEKADTVRAIVIRGSAGIYGAEPAAPQFFTEDMSRLYPLRTRFQRDVGEIENLFETYRRRHPHVTCTMLRYQPSIGPSHDTQVTRYLSMPLVPTYLGFDPRIQFVHERDAIDAFVAAVKNPVRGAVNVAAPGTIGLTRAIRMAGKLSLPLAGPLFPSVTSAGKRLGLVDFSPDFRRLLRYGRAVDTQRLVEEVGFEPRFDTVEAVADYVRHQGGRRLAPTVRQAVSR
ncbi:MAG TPA: NAD-dependent epimerase/dehydratase family protein [Thermoleophilaceae bacterium]|nr:NAD-dependent epimerase/dehydratase family protein [Thermoleophilaceae bacterium]